MHGKKQLNKLQKALKNSFVITGSEVTHIKQVYFIEDIYHFHHTSHLYTEISICVDAVTYSLNNDKIKKQPIEKIYFTIDTSKIVKATPRNLSTLLLDDCKLIRESAADWYRENKAA